MSTTPLSNTEELIERSFFHRVRKELVDKGYLPDITDTVTYPDTQAGWDAWNAAIDAIVANKGFAIEVFGFSSSKSKGMKKTPRIVINNVSSLPGTVGGDSTYFYERSSTTGPYSQLIRPPQTVDFILQVIMSGVTAEQMRILNAVVALSLPRRGYIEFYDDPDHKFFIENTGSNSYDNTRDNQIDKIIAYTAPDLYDIEEIILNNNIAPIQEIRIEPTINGHRSPDFDIIVTN